MVPGLHCSLALKPHLVRKDGEHRKREVEERFEAAILGYLAENPDAMDTLEGIAEFWVLHNTVRTDVDSIVRVMNRLVERGVVERVGRGPKARYRLKDR